MKTRLNKAEVQEIVRIQARIDRLLAKYNERDIELSVEGNGTVASNLDCASASLETILQEYF